MTHLTPSSVTSPSPFDEPPIPVDMDDLYGYADPHTEDDVERILARIANKREEARRVKSAAVRMAETASKEADYLESRARPLLEAFARNRLASLPSKRKSVPLLNGTLGWRIKPGNIVFDTDREEEAIKWARANVPDAVQDKPVLSRSVLKDALTVGSDGVRIVCKATGETVTWAKSEEEDDQFFVKAGA